jgi:FKBP-type peptidyl-prolyl cis-trans isomerase 2
MHQAGYGDRITVHYIGTLDNGRIFDSREEDSPLQITLGSKEIFPALEEQIIGMCAGEVKNIEIRAADAFGERKRGDIISLPRSSFPGNKTQP